ncbi:glycerol-3-phosphate dehydrogenase/oxidase [Roseibaca sp. Y0-43]|nr:glycerol-3-phosphate dehydrogenase/oxidase [Roseibaca sp. Y0-43]
MPERCDVLILGAGVNGAGLFRDLALQGVSVVLADKGDYGGGSSAAPSRLIHGGLKYLETGELRLVAQSTYERNLLLRNAPHLVSPLPTVIPIMSRAKGIGAALRTLMGSTTAPRSRGAALIWAGLMMYDFYGARARVMPRHQMWHRRRALREIPALTPAIRAAGQYYDAHVTYPERLVLELVQDGLRAGPQATAMNHTALLGADAGRVGLRGPDGAEQWLAPRLVVNAAGPWIDLVNGRLGAPSRFIGGTKGSHILLDHPDLLRALGGKMVYFEADDGRICLAFPHLGRVLVGSTDIRADNPDTVACDEDEVGYFLTALRGLFPALSFGEDQIVHVYSGIRPLPVSEGTAAGLISRDHSTPELPADDTRPFAILSMVGGKWTTFRGFAEEVADTVLARLGRPRRTGTDTLPIGGGRDYPDDRAAWAAQMAEATGCTPLRAGLLLGRYGSVAAEILRAEGSAPTPLPDAPDHSVQEIRHILTHEHVVHLQDMVLRRTSLAITGQITEAGLQALADLAATHLGWDSARRSQELDDTRALLRTRHRNRV